MTWPAALEAAAEAVVALHEAWEQIEEARKTEPPPIAEMVGEVEAVQALLGILSAVRDRLEGSGYDQVWAEFNGWSATLDDGTVVEVSRSSGSKKADGKRIVSVIAARLADEMPAVILTLDEHGERTGESTPAAAFVLDVCERLAEAGGLYRSSHSWAKGATAAYLGDVDRYVEAGQRGPKRVKVTRPKEEEPE